MNKSAIARLAILIVVIILLIAIQKYTPAGQWFQFENLREFVESAGPWAYLVYLIAFTSGLLLSVPGFLLVALGTMLFGLKAGFLLGYLGAVSSSVIHFIVFSRITGNPFEGLQKGMLKKLMDGIEKHPFRTVFVVRLVLYISPPANFALAVSGIELKPLVNGTVAGNIAPTTLVVLITHFGVLTLGG